MARKPKADGIGHNSGEPLSDEDRAALVQFHAVNIFKAEHVAARAKADYDAAKSDLRSHFAKVKGDLGFTRKDFEEVLTAMKMTEAEFRSTENRRNKRFQLAGLPVGKQLDLFAAGDTVDEKVAAEAEGYRAGRRADDPVPPKTVSPILHPDWMAGWHRGQAENSANFRRAAEILEARKAKAVGLDAVEEDVGDDDIDEEDVLDDAARKLKRTGWANPAPAEDAFGGFAEAGELASA